VAVTLSGDTGTLYINGENVGENNTLSLRPLTFLGETSKGYIGKSHQTDSSEDPYYNSYLHGMIDDFRFSTGL